MSKYKVIGPIKISYQKGKRGLYISENSITEFWKESKVEKIKKDKGCYVFGIRAAKGIIPYYVGMTSRRDFENECFTDHKCNKYNHVLSETGKGSPVMFFVVHPTKRGKTNARQIREIEEFLTKLESTRNEDNLNVQNNKNEDWAILGVTGGRKPSSSAKEFKKMMGIS